MTNLEYIKTLDTQQFHEFIFKKTGYMCLQECASNKNVQKYVWQKHCLNKYGGGSLLGCDRCRIDWLNSELGELENQLENSAKEQGVKV